MTVEMPVRDKVKDMAQELADSPQFQCLYTAQEKMEKDPEAKRLLEQMQRAQQEVQQLQMTGQQLGAERLQEIQSLQKEFQSNPVIQEWMGAQREVQQLVSEVSQMLTEYLGVPFGSSGCGPSGC